MHNKTTHTLQNELLITIHTELMTYFFIELLFYGQRVFGFDRDTPRVDRLSLNLVAVETKHLSISLEKNDFHKT